MGLQPRILGLQLNLLLLLLQLDLHLSSALLLLCQQILRRQLLRLQHLCLHLLHLYFLCQPQHTVLLDPLDQKDQVTRIRLHVPSSPSPWTPTMGPLGAKLRRPPPAGRLCSMVSSVHTKCLDLKLNDTFAFWGFDNKYWREQEFSSSGLWFRDDRENFSKYQNVWPWLTHIITQLTGFDPQPNYPPSCATFKQSWLPLETLKGNYVLRSCSFCFLQKYSSATVPSIAHEAVCDSFQI